ncbi:DUF1775 domain-containing protein [Oerskovia turbata]
MIPPTRPGPVPADHEPVPPRVSPALASPPLPSPASPGARAAVARRRGARLRRRARAIAVLALAALVSVVAAQGAAAHVLLETATPNGDGTTTLTFSFEHGCDGAPTTGLDVTLPDGVEVVSTTEPEGWSAAQEPGAVRWQGAPVANGEAARFEMVVTLTGSIGQAFVFPTTQTCSTGSSDWVDTDPGAGHPAPRLIATAATLAPSPGPGLPGPAQGAGQGASLGQALAATAAGAVVAAASATWWTRRRRV